MSREAVAGIEIGNTSISRKLSILLCTFFLLSVFIVPLVQYGVDRADGISLLLTFPEQQETSSGDSFFTAVNRINKLALKQMHVVEASLEDNSLLRKVFLPPLQYVLLRFLGQGNEKAVVGRDGWLFFTPGVDYLVGPPLLDPEQQILREESHEIWENPPSPDPLGAIIDFKEQLAIRDIDLVVVPVPIKGAIHPEKLSSHAASGPLSNRSFATLVSLLEDSGVHVYDARPVLARYARTKGDAYLATDTHWRPEAMQVVAAGLAEYVTENLETFPQSLSLQLQPQKVVGQGDVARMVTLPDKVSLYNSQEVSVHQVITEDNVFWQPDRNSEILLLGDSFTNIYSLKGLGWGFGGGFAEHLSYALQHPLDLLARNDAGAYATREMLATELGRGRDRLSGKKLVIWQFAERELAFGDWKGIKLKLGEVGESTFLVAEPGEILEVHGLVKSISQSPRPGSVPYRDNLVTIHLVDLQSAGEPLASDQALVYGWGMQDNKLSDLSGVRPGDNLSILLSSWEEVEGEYGSYRRTPLDDEMLELELPNWGSVIDEKNM
ncbi:MAG: alginate O-acetyltransferase AlgX-related protein [Desulforhopalus sp.]